MSESKSLLARLLAKENITVQHGNYQTAYFNVQDRVLGLPLWKDDDKDLYDMLVGHEVGHALFTPAEGWVDMQKAAKDERVPGDYLNVVEDIRIERKVQGQYPGIVRSFKNGYHYLSKSDFFGLDGRDPNDMGLMDRINLKAKLRDLVQINFSETEMPLVKKAFEAETWDEVVEAARDLYNYVRQSQDSTATETTRDHKGDQPESQDPTAGNETTEEEETSDDQEADTDSQETGDEDPDSTGDQTDEPSDSETGAQGLEEEDEADEVETYQNSLKNQYDLLEKNENGSVPSVIYGLTREQMDRITIPFSTVRDARFKAREEHIAHLKDTHNSSRYASDDWLQMKYDEINTDESYKEFVAETKRVVNMMAKEFELRKAAYQYSRASTSRSGALNMDKLHEYKINDDIFRRVTKLADSKSHGMVMLIDNSASMCNERGAVITQVLNMAMFCKRVNIPFDVYSFTNTSYRNMDPAERRHEIRETLPPEAIDHTNSLLTHILSSSFSRYDYDTAYRQLYDMSRDTPGSNGNYDAMSGTPLNDILTGMHMKLKDFKQKHQLQKVIFTVLTDGDSNTFDTLDRSAMYTGMRSGGARVLLSETRQMIQVRRMYDSVHVTEKLLDGLRKEVLGLVNIGYFVAPRSSDFSTAVARVNKARNPDALREARKVANKNKFVSYDSVIGYDRYFILKADKDNLEATSDDFEIPTAAKRNEITRAFKKYAKSKKGNRVLATQFAEIVS